MITFENRNGLTIAYLLILDDSPNWTIWLFFNWNTAIIRMNRERARTQSSKRRDSHSTGLYTHTHAQRSHLKMVTQRKINGTNNRVIVHVGVEECENDFHGMGEWNERKSGDKKRVRKRQKPLHTIVPPLITSLHRMPRVHLHSEFDIKQGEWKSATVSHSAISPALNVDFSTRNGKVSWAKIVEMPLQQREIRWQKCSVFCLQYQINDNFRRAKGKWE